jgi:predicted regulator of Ras-like GTPase activity (Roadblock/LC7/MglB family)
VTVDEAIRDLLSISTDIRRLAVLDDGGAVLGAGPEGAGAEVSVAADGLWRAAAGAAERGADTAAHAPLDHVVVDLGDAAVVALEAGGRRIVAVTAASPPLGLVLFDLRTCLADAFPEEGPQDDPPSGATGAAAVKETP